MGDPSVVDPAGSSYNNMPRPADVPVGEVPEMSMDRVLPRQQSTGLARGVQQLGTPNLSVDSGENQIIVADTVGQVNTNRVLMGNQQVYGEGFYVTKPGIDAKTAKSGDDFIFNSNQNVFKIIDDGTLDVAYSFASNSGSGYVDDYAEGIVRHDLGFIPGMVVYATFNYSNNPSQIPVVNGSIASFSFGGGSGFAFAVSTYVVYADATTLGLGISRWTNLGNGAFSSTMAAESGTINFKYYLLQESAN